MRAPYFLGGPLALALLPKIESAARFALSIQIGSEKITKWQLCGQYTYMVGTRTKIVQCQQGYFGPPTQFSPYIGCYSFLIQGLLNFESALPHLRAPLGAQRSLIGALE